jgi:hypothetical protein
MISFPGKEACRFDGPPQAKYLIYCRSLPKKMRKTILLLTFLLFSSNIFSQGGVNVNYIPVDSINTRYIGQKCKIDFKSKKTKEYIQKIRIPDTVNIVLNNRQIDLIEVKGTGTDYWYFSKESLKSYNYQHGHLLKIDDIEIQKMTADSILFRMTFELYSNKKPSEQIGTDKQDIWIKKGKLDGVLLKK